MEVEQYSELEEILFNAAKGGGLETTQEVQSEDYVDQQGRKRHAQRVKQAQSPDIALALKLLDQRIGGPQDYC